MERRSHYLQVYQRLREKELDDYLHKDATTAEIMLKKILASEKERKAIAGVTKAARERAKKVALHNSKLRDCRVHFNDTRAPKDNDRREETSIFITEGLSASGSITKIRDVETQAVFSLRGKPLNTYGLAAKRWWKMRNLHCCKPLSTLRTASTDYATTR